MFWGLVLGLVLGLSISLLGRIAASVARTAFVPSLVGLASHLHLPHLVNVVCTWQQRLSRGPKPSFERERERERRGRKCRKRGLP